MTVVLDSDGITMLAKNRARLQELRRRDKWPAIVPSVALTEALCGDHRRDFHENRLLRACDIRSTGEELARSAATLRAGVTGSQTPSAVDAIVVALADAVGGATVITSDPRDLRALAQHTTNKVTIAAS